MTDRDNFWLELVGLQGWVEAPWLIGCDFNLTRYCGERSGPKLYLEAINEFNDIIRGLEWIEPPLNARQFTWSNDWDPPCESLTGSFTLLDWDDIFPLSSAKVLSRPLSEHSPILMDTEDTIHKRRPFRFENIWMEHPFLLRQLKISGLL